MKQRECLSQVGPLQQFLFYVGCLGFLLLPQVVQAKTPLKWDPVTKEMLQSMPPQTILVSIRLGHWRHVHRYLEPFVKLAKKHGQTNQKELLTLPWWSWLQRLSSPTPRAIQALFALLGQKMMRLSLRPGDVRPLLKHIDRHRPIIFAPFAMDSARMRHVEKAGLIPLHHSIQKSSPLSSFVSILHLPTPRPVEMSRLLRQLNVNKTRLQWKDCSKFLARKGAQATHAGGNLGSFFIVLVPEKSFLRVIFLQNSTGFEQRGKQSWETYNLTQTRRLLSRRARPIRLTPALAQWVGQPHLAALYFHGERFLRLSYKVGLVEAYKALTSAQGDLRKRLLSLYYSIAFVGQRLLSSAMSEFEDLAVSLSFHKGLNIGIVSSLTGAGQALYKSIASGSVSQMKRVPGPYLLDYTMNLSLNPIFEKRVQTLPYLAHSKVLFGKSLEFYQISMMFRNCGIFCPWALVIKGPLYAARGIFKSSIDQLPKEAQARISRLLPTQVRILIPAPASPRQFRDLVKPKWSIAAVLPGALSKTDEVYLTILVRRRFKGAVIKQVPMKNKRTCLLIGVKMDPSLAFGACALRKGSRQRSKSLHLFRFSFGELRRIVSSIAASLPTKGRISLFRLPMESAALFLKPLATAVASAAIEGGARRSSLRLATSQMSAKRARRLVFSGTATPLPMPVIWPPQRSQRCLAQLQILHSQLAKAIDGATPKYRPLLVQKFWKLAAPRIRCLAQDGQYKSLAKYIESIWKGVGKM